MALVLAVDDRKELLDGIASVLESEHSCILAQSGADALLAYMNNRPSLVLLDLLMPGMNGREVAQRIMEMDPNARIVIFSIVENIREIVALFQQGVCDFLAKPCDPETLKRIVNSNLSLLPDPAGLSRGYAASLRATVLDFVKGGLIPVLAGHRGIGKRTAVKEAFRAAGVRSPIVIGPMPSSNLSEWFGACLRYPPHEPGGVVAWAPGKTLMKIGADERVGWWVSARKCTLAQEGRLVGITVDIPVGVEAGALLPGPTPGFGVAEVAPLSQRPEDISAFIAHLESTSACDSFGRANYIQAAVADNPALGTLNTVRVMLEVPGFLKHVIGGQD